MRQPTARLRIGTNLGAWLAVLAVWAGTCGLAHGQTPAGPPPDLPQSSALEERLRRVEEMNARLLEQLKSDRQESARRYGELEDRYRELQRRLGEPRPAADAETAPEPGETTGRASHLGRPGEVGRPHATRELPLKARFADGFQLASEDDEFDLRFHVLDQTDFKLFIPNDRTFGKSGLYIPRVRVYLEGRLTRFWEYEVSLQRSLDGTWDLLDGNLNLRLSEAFQVKFGRFLVPYSYDWFDHLEQYFIAPERALFPLNFGLSRQAGLMAWGRAREGRLDWALGGFNGHLTGLADNNPNQEAVGYFNLRPFLGSDRFPALRHLNVGASGAIGQVARNEAPLPLRTSVQAAENDEATTNASAVFLNFNEGAVYQGDRLFGAVHLAYYYRGLSFESEWNIGRFQMTRPGLRNKPEIPVQGFHTTLAYFVTGEEIERRTTVVPLRPFRPFSGEWGPGAIEPFIRYSQLNLGDILFKDDLANGSSWTNDVSMVDLGVNWYPNRWIKFYLDWQHAAFGSPVLVNEAKGIFGRSTDLFWVRCQVYF
ncbi:MAG: OprO/OprP family phosphate-selective porin [Isosphaeraceae bacterium]